MNLVGPGSRILLSRMLQVAANAAVVVIVAKILGPTGQGHYSLTVALGLLTASFLAGGQGLAAVPLLRQGRIPGGRIFRAQLLWVGGALAVLAGLAAVTLLPGPAAFMASHLGWFRGMGFLLSGAVMGILLFEIFSYDLLAKGRLVVGSVINGTRASLHFVLALAVVLTSVMTLGRAVGLVAVAQLFGGVLVVVVAARALANGGPSPSRGGERQQGDSPAGLSLPAVAGYLARRGWLGQLSAVAYFLLLRLDQALLENFRGAAEVGVYSVAVYFGEMLWLLPGALTPLLVHSASVGEGEPARDLDSLRAARLGFLVTLGVGVPLFFLAVPLLSLLAGGEYSASGQALRALLPGIVVFAPGAVLAGDFIGRGLPHWNTQASVATLAINIAAGLWLIPRYGAVGAGWASSIAYTCGSLIMIVRFLSVSGFSLRVLITGKP